LLLSFLYLALRKIVELISLRPRTSQFKELEIVAKHDDLKLFVLGGALPARSACATRGTETT
jgi:hypothetical protein